MHIQDLYNISLALPMKLHRKYCSGSTEDSRGEIQILTLFLLYYVPLQPSLWRIYFICRNLISFSNA